MKDQFGAWSLIKLAVTFHELKKNFATPLPGYLQS